MTHSDGSITSISIGDGGDSMWSGAFTFSYEGHVAEVQWFMTEPDLIRYDAHVDIFKMTVSHTIQRPLDGTDLETKIARHANHHLGELDRLRSGIFRCPACGKNKTLIERCADGIHCDVCMMEHIKDFYPDGIQPTGSSQDRAHDSNA